MEGVVDHLMREMLTDIGGYDLCVTEFVRVVDQLLPEKVFTGFVQSLSSRVAPAPVHRSGCNCWGRIRCVWQKMRYELSVSAPMALILISGARLKR